MNNLTSTAIYIHIPFCDHKCIYCDFYSLVNYDNIDVYLKYLKKEITHYSTLYSENRIIDTIFFGGGTPSFMSSKYIGDIIQTISQNFNLSPDAEITLETNPGTVSKDGLINFRKVGINRISIGIQSFDETELKFLTRIHDKQTAINTVMNAADSGFENISIDLIFSLPNQTKKTWEENLNIAVNLPIKHISAYSLILEKGTILNKMILDGKVKMTNENHDAELYKYSMEFFEQNGFLQYEISNFAKSKYECKHNLYYWQYKDYLSFGTAAHSFVNGKRWWNFSSLKKYINDVELNGHAIRGSEQLEKTQMIDEFVMLGLRSKGLNLDKAKSYSPDWYFEKKQIINSFIKERYLEETNNLLSCTRKGYMICDEIINKLL
jgi:oxygen-independent coproporphyrinogen III oxidase